MFYNVTSELTFTAWHEWYLITTKTAALEYEVSNTCANVTLNTTDVIDIKTGVVNDVVY